MKTLYLIQLVLLFFFTNGCSIENNLTQSSNDVNQSDSHSNHSNIAASQLKRTYMYTGFYFLADKGNGVKMREDNSENTYTLSPKPFVSVKNILQASLKKDNIEQGTVSSILMIMDNKGTNDLEEGTGNKLHPYIAVVIANKLLYVVENKTKIKTGKMQIVLSDYSEAQINKMLNDIKLKR